MQSVKLPKLQSILNYSELGDLGYHNIFIEESEEDPVLLLYSNKLSKDEKILKEELIGIVLKSYMNAVNDEQYRGRMLRQICEELKQFVNTYENFSLPSSEQQIKEFKKNLSEQQLTEFKKNLNSLIIKMMLCYTMYNKENIIIDKKKYAQLYPDEYYTQFIMFHRFIEIKILSMSIEFILKLFKILCIYEKYNNIIKIIKPGELHAKCIYILLSIIFCDTNPAFCDMFYYLEESLLIFRTSSSSKISINWIILFCKYYLFYSSLYTKNINKDNSFELDKLMSDIRKLNTTITEIKIDESDIKNYMHEYLKAIEITKPLTQESTIFNRVGKYIGLFSEPKKNDKIFIIHCEQEFILAQKIYEKQLEPYNLDFKKK